MVQYGDEDHYDVDAGGGGGGGGVVAMTLMFAVLFAGAAYSSNCITSGDHCKYNTQPSQATKPP